MVHRRTVAHSRSKKVGLLGMRTTKLQPKALQSWHLSLTPECPQTTFIDTVTGSYGLSSFSYIPAPNTA